MKEEKDVYNLPIAAFTFGKNGQILPFYPLQDLKDNSKDKDNIIKKNDSRKNNYSIESKGSKDSNNYSNDDSEKRFSFKNIILKKKENTHKNNSNNININKNLNININNNNFNNNNFVFIDKEDSNISYIKTVLYSISYMKLLNNYLITEIKFNNKEKINSREILLSIIRDILIKIEQVRNKDANVNNSIHINNIINIEQLKENLSNLFKDKKKFVKNNPDDPIDFLYIIINFLHSLKIKKESNELYNNACSEDCFSHKYLWIKMLKIYECECKAQSKKILNKNNYFIDIPINVIINKFLKTNIYDMNQNLFIYYKKIISNHIINIDCPKYGNECKINKVHYKYILKNFPSYLIFNLDNNYFKSNELYYPLKDILKNFILIPHTLNIGSLFDIDIKNYNNKNLYELIGIIFLKISKVYTCIFKQNGLFYYYEDDIFINFNNYYDIILFSLKNGLIPISIFYQNIDLNLDKNNNDINYELTKEQIIRLEKYVKNTNNLNKNLKNKIRTKENIILDNYIINYTISVHNNNQSLSDNYNNSSRYSGSINSYSSYQKNEYICNHCERINKIENKICFFCGYDNKPFINSNTNKNIKKQKSHKINNKNKINKKISLNQENDKKLKNNELGEIEDEYKNIDPHVLKYFDMPRPYIPIPKEKEKNNSPKQTPKLDKNRIPYNNTINNSNNLKNDKIIISNNKKEIIKINNLDNKNKLNNSEQKDIEKNLLNRLNQRNSNISHKKINNSDNLLNNNFYSELNNKPLNINLKINNNNNYNIFDFSNKKDLINIDYGKKGDNFTEKKLLKKMNLIKHQKLNKYTIINNNSNDNIANNNLNFNFINNKNISNSNDNLNNANFGHYFPNKNRNWICPNCLVPNENNLNNCINCKMGRNININFSSNKYYSTNNANINNLLKENIDKRK